MLNYNGEYSGIKLERILEYQDRINQIDELTICKKTIFNQYLGWIDYPIHITTEEIGRIKSYAAEIKNNSDVLIVIGTGGSYIGARAVIEALKFNFYYQVYDDDKTPKIYFLGNTLSEEYTVDLLKAIDGKDVSVNVISKSGGTVETVAGFSIIAKYMKEKYGEDFKSRFYITTDAKEGSLRHMVERDGLKSLSIPADIGGRFSVLTSVGLLPMAVAGIDIDEILEGAKIQRELLTSPDLKTNSAYRYAVTRNILYNKGKEVELLVTYKPKLRYFSEWWKQLFAESEGKQGKGIFPAYAIFSTDLHSLGQMIQEGKENIFETVIFIKEDSKKLKIEEIDPVFGSELELLKGKSLGDLNKMVFESTLAAHTETGIPNLLIEIEKLDERNMGELIYFFERAVAMSGMLLGVNPFDQPGVEAYKKKMKEKFKY